MESNSSSGHLHADKAEQEKFAVGADVSVDCGAPLPDGYGDDRLVILPRDPFWFFAYWEITPACSEQIRRDHGQNIWEQAALVLRVYDLANAPNGAQTAPFFDVEVSKQTRQWYVKVETPGRHYLTDLGLRWPDGRFVSLLRSNRIQLPRGQISEKTDAAWMAVGGAIVTEEEWKNILSVPGGGVAGGPGSGVPGSSEFSKGMAQRWEFLKSVFSSSWMSSPRSSFSLTQTPDRPQEKKS